MNARPRKLAGYEHFLAVSQRQAWDAEAIDLAPDRDAWPFLERRDRASVARLVAGFCVGEAAVAGVLEPFADRLRGALPPGHRRSAAAGREDRRPGP